MHEVMPSFCAALIMLLLLPQPHLLPLVWGMALHGKGGSAGKYPKGSSEKNWRFCKCSVLYCAIQRKKEAGDGS